MTTTETLRPDVVFNSPMADFQSLIDSLNSTQHHVAPPRVPMAGMEFLGSLINGGLAGLAGWGAITCLTVGSTGWFVVGILLAGIAGGLAFTALWGLFSAIGHLIG